MMVSRWFVGARLGARPVMCPGPKGPAGSISRSCCGAQPSGPVPPSVRLGRLSYLLVGATMRADADTRLTAGEGGGPMEVRLLGSLELAEDGLPVAVGGV